MYTADDEIQDLKDTLKRKDFHIQQLDQKIEQLEKQLDYWKDQAQGVWTEKDVERYGQPR